MKRLALAAATLAFAVSLTAQVRTGIEHTAPGCVRGGELPLFQVKAQGEGKLRAYFRRINTTDWCSVEGTNEGPLSRVALPKFENGDEIEYFFVLVDGENVVSRSPRIYRTRVTADCGTVFARHATRLDLSCGDDAQAIPAAMGAGYLTGDDIIDGNPPRTSPDRPESQRPPQP